ncbi:MAG: hypothetical protein Q9179_006011 [Wetmoreana sp. 5 TL-2023]
MNEYIGNELDKRYREYRTDPHSKRTKAVIDLVFQAYKSQDRASLPETLDSAFRLFAIRQIRTFFFAGHDSTSSTICYIFHLLASNPSSLAHLRAEHDLVFGSVPSNAASLLSSKPQLTKSLPYTQAVIKESLRLFPPAASTRAGKRAVSLTSDTGVSLPTADAIVFIVHVEMHRSPKYWPYPDDFLPERWLVDPEHELYPQKGAWRAFEHGPRNCIAQELVMMELSVLLVMVAREFDFRECYDEWDRSRPEVKPFGNLLCAQGSGEVATPALRKEIFWAAGDFFDAGDEGKAVVGGREKELGWIADPGQREIRLKKNKKRAK